jgi:hypoxanthine-guanine phosphoribosyltransferase
VILVDDGMATGATMIAAIRSSKSQGAKEVIVAAPVAPPDTLKRIEKVADHVVCLYAIDDFQAVSQFYTEMVSKIGFSAAPNHRNLPIINDPHIINIGSFMMGKFPKLSRLPKTNF